MMQKTTSKIKTHPSLKVSYMCDTLNKRVNIENIKDAMATALKNVRAAPGACREVKMLHVIETTHDICKTSHRDLIVYIHYLYYSI